MERQNFYENPAPFADQTMAVSSAAHFKKAASEVYEQFT